MTFINAPGEPDKLNILGTSHSLVPKHNISVIICSVICYQRRAEQWENHNPPPQQISLMTSKPQWGGIQISLEFTNCQMYNNYVCMYIMCSPVDLNLSFFFVIGLYVGFFFFLYSVYHRGTTWIHTPCVYSSSRGHAAVKTRWAQMNSSFLLSDWSRIEG